MESFISDDFSFILQIRFWIETNMHVHVFVAYYNWGDCVRELLLHHMMKKHLVHHWIKQKHIGLSPGFLSYIHCVWGKRMVLKLSHLVRIVYNPGS